MPDIIKEKDPRGVVVSCSTKQWNEHVTFNHPVMQENMQAIISTIQSPDSIHESHDSDPPKDYREIYTKKVETATYYPKIPYTKVVTSCIGGSAEIVTAYPAPSKEGGRMPDKEAIYGD